MRSEFTYNPAQNSKTAGIILAGTVFAGLAIVTFDFYSGLGISPVIYIIYAVLLIIMAGYCLYLRRKKITGIRKIVITEKGLDLIFGADEKGNIFIPNQDIMSLTKRDEQPRSSIFVETEHKEYAFTEKGLGGYDTLREFFRTLVSSKYRKINN